MGPLEAEARAGLGYALTTDDIVATEVAAGSVVLDFQWAVLLGVLVWESRAEAVKVAPYPVVRVTATIAVLECPSAEVALVGPLDHRGLRGYNATGRGNPPGSVDLLGRIHCVSFRR